MPAFVLLWRGRLDARCRMLDRWKGESGNADGRRNRFFQRHGQANNDSSPSLKFSNLFMAESSIPLKIQTLVSLSASQRQMI